MAVPLLVPYKVQNFFSNSQLFKERPYVSDENSLTEAEVPRLRHTIYSLQGFQLGHSTVHCIQTLVGENSCLLMQATEERSSRSLEECRKPVEKRESWKSGRCRMKSSSRPTLVSPDCGETEGTADTTRYLPGRMSR
jgi:hypothetical protein